MKSIHLEVLDKLDAWEANKDHFPMSYEELGRLVRNNWDTITSSLFLVDRYDLAEKLHKEVRGGNIK
ncbi:hypothetical protein CON64_22675 [Bacillus pseudomycoides]|nr:hypothetical protein CON64_22675 [Bacillus pseudomycoides]